MLWIASNFRDAFGLPASDAYGALADLAPTDQFVEKQGRSTGRYLLAGSEGPIGVFVKKYYRLPWWQRWFAAPHNLPGPRELSHLRRVAALGIPAPEPMAAGASRNHRCKSLLAVRELEGFVPLHEFIPARFAETDAKANVHLRRQLTERLAWIARRLHRERLYHRDFYLCHFFIRERPDADQPFELTLIDLLRLKQSLLPRWRIKDLAQLWMSSEVAGITQTDRLRFFKRYLQIDRLDTRSRRLLRRVQRKTALYRRHNEKQSALNRLGQHQRRSG